MITWLKVGKVKYVLAFRSSKIAHLLKPFHIFPKYNEARRKNIWNCRRSLISFNIKTLKQRPRRANQGVKRATPKLGPPGRGKYHLGAAASSNEVGAAARFHQMHQTRNVDLLLGAVPQKELHQLGEIAFARRVQQDGQTHLGTTGHDGHDGRHIARLHGGAQRRDGRVLGDAQQFLGAVLGAHPAALLFIARVRLRLGRRRRGAQVALPDRVGQLVAHQLHRSDLTRSVNRKQRQIISFCRQKMCILRKKGLI